MNVGDRPAICPACKGRVGRPSNAMGPGNAPEPPDELVRYLAVWAYLRTVEDLPEMADRINEVFATEYVYVVAGNEE